MEAWVGARWHHWVSRQADPRHAAAQVTLAEVQKPIALLLHAAGGQARVAPAAPVAVGGERGFWQRVAGSGHRASVGQLDDTVLALPSSLAVHAERALNHDLYLWLAALAAHLQPGEDWLTANLAATRRTLQALPGLLPRWRRLVAAELALRPPAPAVGSAEARVQAALQIELQIELPSELQRGLQREPHTVAPACGNTLPPWPAGTTAADPRTLAPVWCWLRPSFSQTAADATAQADGGDDGHRGQPPSGPPMALMERRRAQHQASEPARAPLLLAPKGEWLKTFADPFALNRTEDDEPDDPADALTAAEELAELTLQARTKGGLAARLRFDLDLPAACNDDLPTGPGEWLPEWDPRRQALLPQRVLAQTLAARAPQPWCPASALQAQARQLRRRLAGQQAAPRWQKGQRDGEALDLDACVRHLSHPVGAAAVYQRPRRLQRDLACLLLADLSLSTDAYANDTQRVVDVVRDALYTFGEALKGGGDAFAMLGFSSVRRHLRLHELKGFDEPWAAPVMARLGAIKPGYHTRMGAALRAATHRLQKRPERQRLLVLLTDGKPHDLDGYEGRLGQEDTRQAVLEARAAGLLPFAVGIDATAPAVLPQLFGSQGWAWVQRPEALPGRLAELYGQLRR